MDIFKLVGSVFVDTEGADKSLQKVGQSADDTDGKFGKILGTAGKVALGVGAMGAAAGTALFGIAKKSAETTDNIDKMSQKLGISRQAYQELNFVMSQSGTDIDKMTAGMKSLLTNMDGVKKGTAGAISKFEVLGVEVVNLDGTLRSQEDVFFDVVSSFQEMEDGAEKTRLATELFGKSGTELMPLLNGASGSIDEMREKANELGLVLSDDAVDAGVQFTDTLDQVTRSFESVVAEIGVAVMPIIQDLLDWIVEHMPEIKAFMQNVFDVFSVIVDAVVKAIIWVKDNFGQYFPVIEDFVKKAFEGIKKLWDEDLKPMFDALIDFVVNVLLPIWDFVFTHGIKPVIEAVFKYIGDMWNGTLKPIFYNIIDFIKNIFSGNFTGAFQNIFNIVGGLFNGFVSLVKIPLNSVIGIVNSFIKSINKLKIPDWIPLIGGSSPDLPTIPLLAKGGNVTSRGSAIVGEAGAELVDLPRGASVTPLGGKGAGGNIEGLLAEMVELMQRQEAMMYRAVSLALKDGIDVDFDSRNLARLIKRYA